MPDTSATAPPSADEGVATAAGPFAIVRERLSLTRLGVTWAVALVAYFAFVVPEAVAVLIVGSALAIVFAAYVPLFGVLTIGRLMGWLSDRLAE